VTARRAAAPVATEKALEEEDVAVRGSPCGRPGTAERRIRRLPLRGAAVAAVVAVGASTAGRALAADPEHPEVRGGDWRLASVAVGVADDFFAPPSRLRDDDGFTAGLRVAAELSDGRRDRLRLDASEQLITERGGPGRVDEGRVQATWERRVRSAYGHELTIGWTMGLDVVGDLGGSGIQDWAHRAIFSGRRLSGQGARALQDRYRRGYDVLALAGGLVRLVHPVSGPWSLRGGVEGVFGFGTGVLGELHPYVAIGFATRVLDLELREGAGIYGTSIRALTMRGGYVTGILQSQPSARLTLFGARWLGTFVSLVWELNRADSHQPVGELAVGKRF
jgi:hypothetical protein